MTKAINIIPYEMAEIDRQSIAILRNILVVQYKGTKRSIADDYDKLVELEEKFQDLQAELEKLNLKGESK